MSSSNASSTLTGMATSTQEKVRENRLRRMATRQGLQLVKSRRRDPRALDYGTYWLVDESGVEVASGDADAIERWLTGEAE
jgi:ribosomal protein L34